jgi:hypothetical protein
MLRQCTSIVYLCCQYIVVLVLFCTVTKNLLGNVFIKLSQLWGYNHSHVTHMSRMPRLFKRSTSDRCGLNQSKLQVTYKLKEIVIKVNCGVNVGNVMCLILWKATFKITLRLKKAISWASVLYIFFYTGKRNCFRSFKVKFGSCFLLSDIAG